MNKKVSLVMILLNEEESIGGVIEGILGQTRQPDEIIFVDGGSSDQTVKIIQDYIAKGAPIKLTVAPGTNSAQAENLAIMTATNEIIAITDAGCRAAKNWLEKLLLKYDGQADIISGVYLPDNHSRFEEALSDLVFPTLNELNAETFLPSNRSIAFKKDVWRKLGGYQEGLRRSDDTWFGLEARRQGFKFVLARDAVVYWRPRSNLRQLFKYHYMDERSSFLHNVYFTPPLGHTVKIAFISLSLIISLFSFSLFIGWLCLFILYLGAKTQRAYLRSENKNSIKLLYYPLIVVALDGASLLGILAGTFGRLVNALTGKKTIRD